MILWLLFILAIYAPYFMWANKTHTGWLSKDENSIKVKGDEQVDISIVIPFRNEDGVIQILLEQLIKELPDSLQSEVILINDHSTDSGVESIQDLLPPSDSRFKLIHSEKEGKKHALSTGINAASNDWIISLDADVVLPNKWFDFISQVCATAETDMVILPVELYPTPKLFQKIEALEFTVLQGITFSYAQQKKAFLANGAHLAFRKQAFIDFNGYSAHEHMASGDDVFLLEQIQQSPTHSVGYSYYADMSVTTTPNRSLLQLLHQKARWGSKTFKFKSKETKTIGLLILVANLGLFALIFSQDWKIFFLGFFIKSICDLYLVVFPLTVRSRKTLLKYIPLFMVVYPFYIIFVSVATLFLKPKWKGRYI